MDRPEIHGGETPDLEPPASTTKPERSWVHELIEMTRPGFEIEFPVRRVADSPIPFIDYDFD